MKKKIIQKKIIFKFSKLTKINKLSMLPLKILKI